MACCGDDLFSANLPGFFWGQSNEGFRLNRYIPQALEQIHIFPAIKMGAEDLFLPGWRIGD